MPTHHVPRQSMTRMIFVLPPLRRILMNGGQGGNVFPACQRIVKADDLHILRDADPLPRQARLTMHRMQTMQGKTRLSRRCAKSVQKCAEPQEMENPTRNLAILRGILVRSRELESLAL